MLERSQSRTELVRALIAHGSALRHARRPIDARGPLRRRWSWRSAVGPAAWRSRPAPRFRHGRAAARRGPAGVGALTASERRVVALAAEGQDNLDIAQSLYVTPRAIENTWRRVPQARRSLAPRAGGSDRAGVRRQGACSPGSSYPKAGARVPNRLVPFSVEGSAPGFRLERLNTVETDFWIVSATGGQLGRKTTSPDGYPSGDGPSCLVLRRGGRRGDRRGRLARRHERSGARPRRH